MDVFGSGSPVGIAQIINTLGMVYTLMIFTYAIFSWFDHSSGFLNDIYRVLDKFVGPFVNLFRRILPTAGGLDFSPFIAIIIVQVVTQFLANTFG
ncbi:MAG: YggT family protein [Coriobacteriia bacterium]|jgi:YggT family protein|nr:YggT family protein [Coriobacteriia bacterium]MDR2714245.1 YggT family protein [Coriobacteriales bacterium]